MAISGVPCRVQGCALIADYVATKNDRKETDRERLYVVQELHSATAINLIHFATEMSRRRRVLLALFTTEKMLVCVRDVCILHCMAFVIVIVLFSCSVKCLLQSDVIEDTLQLQYTSCNVARTISWDTLIPNTWSRRFAIIYNYNKNYYHSGCSICTYINCHINRNSPDCNKCLLPGSYYSRIR